MKTKSLLIFSIITLGTLFQSCKEDCGCDDKSKISVSNIEAIYDGEFDPHGIYVIDSLDTNFYEFYAICNEEIIPDNIKSDTTRIRFVVDGNVGSYCNVRGEVEPETITITNIRLKDKNK